MPALDSKALPLVAQAVMVALVLWGATNSRASIDGAVAASHRLPVVEQKLTDQGRRIERLEAMDGKLDRMAETLAALVVEVKSK